MPTYTAPTTRTTGELISAAIYNTDLVENIKYFKDAPAFAGNVTVGGTLGVTGATTLSSATYTTNLKSTTALATPSALTATQATAFASTVSGSAIMGFGTTNDVALMNRAGTVVLGIGPNTTTVNMTGLLTVSGFGTSSFSAGGTGANIISLRNTTAGASMRAQLQLGNDLAADQAILRVFSSTFTTSGPNVADGAALSSYGTGGVSIAAESASGAIRFYSGGTTERWRVETTGNLQPAVNATYDLGTTSLGIRRVHITGDDVIYAPNSGSNSGTAIVQHSSNYWYRLTSSRRYKEHFSPFVVTDDQLQQFTALSPQNWDYIGSQNGAAGFISEDLEALGILNRYGRSPLINYNDEGLVESNRDYAIIGLQHLVLQQHDATITQLAARIAALEAQEN